MKVQLCNLLILAGRAVGLTTKKTSNEIAKEQQIATQKTIDEYVTWAEEIMRTYLRCDIPEIQKLLSEKSLDSIKEIEENELLNLSKKLGCAPQALNELHKIWKRLDVSKEGFASVIIPRLTLCRYPISEELLLEFANKTAESLKTVMVSSEHSESPNINVDSMGYHNNFYLSPVTSEISSLIDYIKRHGFDVSSYGDNRHDRRVVPDVDYFHRGSSVIIVAMEKSKVNNTINLKAGVLDVPY